MAAIEGFELSIATGDVVVADGLADGVAIEGATLDAAAIADGTAIIVVRAGALVIDELSAQAADDVVLGSCTIATGAASAPSLTHRGRDLPVSADI